jgi:hydrogenase maturation factor
VTASPEESPRIVEALAADGIRASIIGQVVDGPPRVQMRTADGLLPLPTFARDEIARVFEDPA